MKEGREGERETVGRERGKEKEKKREKGEREVILIYFGAQLKIIQWQI